MKSKLNVARGEPLRRDSYSRRENNKNEDGRRNKGGGGKQLVLAVGGNNLQISDHGGKRRKPKGVVAQPQGTRGKAGTNPCDRIKKPQRRVGN